MSCPPASDDDRRLIMNIAFYLYSQKPKLISLNELKQQPSLTDFELNKIKDCLQIAKKDFWVDEKIGNDNDAETKYTIGHEGIIHVENTIHDYVTDSWDCFDGVEDGEKAMKAIEKISKNEEKTQLARLVQDLVWKYKNGIFYEGF